MSIKWCQYNKNKIRNNKEKRENNWPLTESIDHKLLNLLLRIKDYIHINFVVDKRKLKIFKDGIHYPLLMINDYI